MKRREFISLLGGVAAAWPLAAQRSKPEPHAADRRARGPREPPSRFEAFRKQLQDLAYVEGKNFTIDWRYAERGPDQLPILAQQLVELHPDVIVSITTPATAAVKATTGSIPIVFADVGDPVETGFVASLSHPGGNLTGQSILAPQLSGKRLELLKETIPASTTFAVIAESDQSRRSFAVARSSRCGAAARNTAGLDRGAQGRRYRRSFRHCETGGRSGGHRAARPI